MEKELLVNRGKGFFLKRGRLAAHRDGVEFVNVRNGKMPMIRNFYPMMDTRGIEVFPSVIGFFYGLAGMIALVMAYAVGSWLLVFVGSVLLFTGYTNKTEISITGRSGTKRWTLSSWHDAIKFQAYAEQKLVDWRKKHALCEYRGL